MPRVIFSVIRGFVLAGNIVPSASASTFPTQNSPSLSSAAVFAFVPLRRPREERQHTVETTRPLKNVFTMDRTPVPKKPLTFRRKSYYADKTRCQVEFIRVNLQVDYARWEAFFLFHKSATFGVARVLEKKKKKKQRQKLGDTRVKLCATV